MLDINNEFRLLKELVNKLWVGCDTEPASTAMTVAFQKGLSDARLWIDEYATFRIAAALNNNYDVCLPLNSRNNFSYEGDSNASLYDALCIFDSGLSSGLGEIYRSVTRYNRWSFSTNADNLCFQIDKDFPDLKVLPRHDCASTQNAIAKSYEGEQAGGSGTLPTPDRLVYSFVQYSKEDQGMSYHRSLFSTIYSHGLYCAKLKNTQCLVSDLLPIYQKRDEPLNFDNGNEILGIALKNPFVALIHRIHPFTFYSIEQYEQDRQRKHEQVEETSEALEKRINDLLASIASDADNLNEYHSARVDQLVDEALNVTSAFVVQS